MPTSALTLVSTLKQIEQLERSPQVSFILLYKTKDTNMYKNLNYHTRKNQQQTKNVDVDSNIIGNKNSIARITQNRRIALFTLWFFNQNEAGKKIYKYLFHERKNNLYDSQSMIKPTNIFKIWVREIIQIVVFHLRFKSIQIFGILFQIANLICTSHFVQYWFFGNDGLT